MIDHDQDNHELKLSIIAILSQLQETDGKATEMELAYILHVANHIGLTEDDVRYVQYNPSEFDLKPPADERDRITILYYLLFFIGIDGAISAEEEKLVYTFGLKLGFREDMVHDLIAVMKKYLNQKVPPNEMINKIRAYLN